MPCANCKKTYDALLRANQKIKRIKAYVASMNKEASSIQLETVEQSEILPGIECNHNGENGVR